MKQLVFVFVFFLVFAAAADFVEGERVAFLGDSITQGGRYLGYLQLFHNLRHPGSRTTFLNAGVSGDTATGGLKRFDWDVAPQKPDRVFVMFGMNDVDHGLYAEGKTGAEVDRRREAVFTRYRGNLAAIAGKVDALGAKLVPMTPTPFDEYAAKASRAPEKGCNEIGLRRMAEIVRETAASNGTETVELFAPFTEILKRHPGRFQPDRVHPGEEGHVLIAAAILLAQGETPLVGETAIDASQLPYRYAPTAFPLPLTDDYRKADEVFPVTDNLNREMLVIRGLEPGPWILEADGQPIGTFSAAALASGVNLALLPTPNQLKAQELAKAAAELATTMTRLRGLAQVRLKLGDKAGDFTDRDGIFAALDAENAEREARKDAYADYYRNVAKNFKETWGKRPEFEKKVSDLRERLAAARPAAFAISVRRR